MTGDQEDMRRRIRLTLPVHWFADVSPVLDGLLTGLSALWAGLYGLLDVVREQARIATAVGEFLDLAARDFFGARLRRREGEYDEAFRSRLLRALRRDRGTRAAVIAAGAEAGYSITVFEPARPADTGAYAVPAVLAWNVGGGWGSVQMPLECLVRARAQDTVVQDELLQAITESLPAGAVAWVRVEH